MSVAALHVITIDHVCMLFVVQGIDCAVTAVMDLGPVNGCHDATGL